MVYSNREKKDALKTIEIIKSLGFPSKQNLISLIRHGNFGNSTLTLENFAAVEDIFGTSIAKIKGTYNKFKPLVISKDSDLS